MTAIEQVLQDIEAKRDMACIESANQQAKADTLGYVASMLRNAIRQDAMEVEARP